ncbi:MAG: DUF302 domain-containing protein [Betaproteobacteria bacterium]|jgi:uncharacterized protein (DUF302 family)|nr:DUF302 domain-containing protein [Betaproteobacteria bacterium]
MPRSAFLLLLFQSALALSGLSAATSAADEVVRHTAKGPYEEVRDAVVMAIEGKGLIVDRVAHVGDMLARTAKDVGASRQLYGKAEVLEFCSARISREMMEADPHQIAICPYTIAVYTLPGEPGVVYVSYRRPPQSKGMEGVHTLLDEIVNEALK